MGWSMESRLTLTKNEVEQILDAIKAKGVFGNSYSKQQWGWSSECDITLYKNSVGFSGAWFSERCSLPGRFRRMAKHMGFYEREKYNKSIQSEA